MNGDRGKSESKFSRWVEYFWDGARSTTKKEKRRVPSPCSKGKRYNRRWIRREGKRLLLKKDRVCRYYKGTGVDPKALYLRRTR